MLWDLWPTFTSDPRLLSGWPSTSRQESDALKSGARVVVTVVSLLILVPAVVMASAVEDGLHYPCSIVLSIPSSAIKVWFREVPLSERAQ